MNHQTVCYKPFVADRMKNKSVSPALTLSIKLTNEEWITQPVNFTIKVGKNVKREFIKIVDQVVATPSTSSSLRQIKHEPIQKSVKKTPTKRKSRPIRQPRTPLPESKFFSF